MKFYKNMLWMLLIALTCSSCGNVSGSTTLLETVMVTSMAKLDSLETDILKGNTCTGTVSSGGTYITDTIPVDIISKSYDNATRKSLVTINSIKISYSKYNTSTSIPLLPDQFDSGVTVLPDTTVTLNVKVAPDSLKLYLVNTLNFNLCTVDYWEYYATITFDAVESYSNRKADIKPVIVKVAFADRV